MTKICNRCGQELPESEFRSYYGGKSGTYSFCKTCERIEQRRKYLVGKGDNLSDIEREELSKIDQLYELRRAAGLKVPTPRRSRGVMDLVDAELKEKTQP